MSLAIPLAAMLGVLPFLQDPEAARTAAAVAPLLGEEVTAVARVDLTRANNAAAVRLLIGKLADEEDVRGGIATVIAWTAALRRAGARDLYLVIDLADMPGQPVVAVPLTAGADDKEIARVLTGGNGKTFVRWPSSETIRGAVVAGSAQAVARIRDAKPVPQPGLIDALATGGDAIVKVAIHPSMTQRRAIEESMAVLPAELGGGPVTTLTRGLRWAAIAFRFEPKPRLDLVLKAEDVTAAEAVRKLSAGALDLLAEHCRKKPAFAAMAPAIRQLKPLAQGDRVTLEANLEDAAELVSLPIRNAREAAVRVQCVNNLKQLGLAMHNYHASHDTFPPAFRVSEDGKPLLSWRVLILPYIGQKALYDEFHLDEAWDSLHNRTLIARMPAIFTCPGGSRALAREGRTSYLTPRGPASIFSGAMAVKIREIPDGTSNTIMIVDARDDAAVTWTKPDDWEVPAEFNAQGLFGHHGNGTNFLFADGAVRFLMEKIKPEVLKALMTRNGGEVISSDSF